MVKSELEKPGTGRDMLSTIEVVVRMVSMILVPVLIWVLGAWYTSQQKELETNRITAENNATRLTSLMKNLASDNPRERKLAVVISRYFAGQNQLPPELVQVLAVIAETDTNKEVSGAAFQTLDAVSKTSSDQAPAARAVLEEMPSRIYIHISDQDRLGDARRIEDLLESLGYQVPGIEVISGFKTSQIRYFHETDQTKATKIMNSLASGGFRLNTVYIQGYGRKVRLGQFEIRFGAK